MAHEKLYSQLWNSTCHWWMEILHYYIFFYIPHTGNPKSQMPMFFFSLFKHMFKTHSNEHNQFDMITRRYKTKETLLLQNSKYFGIWITVIHCIKRFYIRSCNFEIMKLTLQKLLKKTQQNCCKMHPILLTEKQNRARKQEHTQFSIWNKKSCLEARYIYHW